MLDFLNNRWVRMAAIRASAVGVALWLQIWLVAAFGSAVYGDYIFFVTLCSLVTTISKGGLDTLALKAAAIAKSGTNNAPVFDALRSGYLAKGVMLTSASCLGLWLLYALAASWRLPNIPTVNWWWVYATSLGMVIFQILIAAMRGLDRPALADAFDAIVRNALMALVALLLVSAQYLNAESVMASFAFSFYAASLMLLMLTPSHQSNAAVEQAEVESYGAKAHFGFMLSGLLSYVFFQMDTLILGAYVSATELGAYNMACNLVRAVIFIPMIVVVLVQPRIAVAFAKSDMRGVARIATVGVGVSFLAASLCSGVLWMLGGFVLTWIDPVFVMAQDAMLLLSLAHIINAVLMVVGGVVSMTHRYLDVVKAQLMGGTATLILYGLLIPHQGQIGAATAMFAGLVMVLLCYLVMYRKFLVPVYGFLLPQAK